MILEFVDGEIRVLRVTKPSDQKWSDVYRAGTWEQSELDRALALIDKDPRKKPPSQPGVYEIDDCAITTGIVLRAASQADDRRHRFAYGWIRGAEIAQVARMLSEQRPQNFEDVAYFRGVGLRISWKKGTQDLLRISSGLIESFLWNGEFGLANPLWPASIMGLDAIASGESFAKALATRGVICDAEALDVVLDAGLRVELVTAAKESE